MIDIQEVLKHDSVVCYKLLCRECSNGSCKGTDLKCVSYSPFHTADYRRILETRAHESGGLIGAISS